MAYARQLAAHIAGLGVRRLEGLANRMFGTPLLGLSVAKASTLIDSLKAVQAGQLDLKSIFNAAAR